MTGPRRPFSVREKDVRLRWVFIGIDPPTLQQMVTSASGEETWVSIEPAKQEGEEDDGEFAWYLL